MEALDQLSGTAAAFVSEPIVQRVARLARLAPDAPALCTHEGHRTYADLARAAARLAARLGRAGGGPETLVGRCLPRAYERSVATLAIWQAGGAVVALDPAWPLARLHALLEASQASLVLAPNALAASLSVDHRCTLVVEAAVDAAHEAADLAAAPISPPLQRPDALALDALAPDALAYVVFTSGSTGAAKAVEITHGNLHHLIEWHLGAFAIRPSDRASHLAGLGFDAAFWEVWPTLWAGASVVLVDDEETRVSPILLQQWLVDQRITVAFVPTVLAEIMMGMDWPAATALRWLLTGGEALRCRPPAGLPFMLVNNYGPSECTVVATSGPVSPGQNDERPDIGQPIARTQVYLLDEQGNPVVDDGDGGEIVIGGAGVGRGYRHRPDLTAERFLPDRFHPAPGARLYRTGDLGRRLPNGCIAFLGRSDDQEQIRGSRVEPAEVAAALSGHPLVRWCTVIGHGAARDRQLVAYVLPIPGAQPTGEALRAFLVARLPELMVPAVYVRIERVPLSPHGKLDRDALPSPEPDTHLAQAAFRAPTTPTEARLAAIIGALLDVPVGVDDNFFLLGGHSLLGTQVLLRARAAFGVPLSLRDLFEAPTVAGLATRVATLLAETLQDMTDEEAALWVAQ